jgi:hypothetical protein
MKLGGATMCRLLVPDPASSPEVDLVGRTA